jgi:enterochelin esterase-like enzyme
MDLNKIKLNYRLAQFRNAHLLIIITLISLSLAACQPIAGKAMVINTPSPFPIVTKTTQPPTPSATPTETVTPAPTLTPTPTPFLGCDATHGVIDSTQAADEKFDRPVDVNILLPPCYSKNYPGGYPVLYLIPGQGQSNQQWINLGVPEAADAFFVSGQLKPYIIVLPREDYYNQNWYESEFDETIVNALVPWVDQHYNTCNLRSCRAIGGISRGATWAVVIGLSHWQLFGAFGAHSLPDAPFSEASTRDFFKDMQPQGYSRIYIDIGNLDGFVSGTKRFLSYLDKYNIPYTWRLYPGSHVEDYWQGHVPEYLLWYGEEWNKRP